MYMKQSMMYRAEKLFERVWCAHEHFQYIGMVLANNRGVALHAGGGVLTIAGEEQLAPPQICAMQTSETKAISQKVLATNC